MHRQQRLLEATAKSILAWRNYLLDLLKLLHQPSTLSPTLECYPATTIAIPCCLSDLKLYLAFHGNKIAYSCAYIPLTSPSRPLHLVVHGLIRVLTNYMYNWGRLILNLRESPLIESKRLHPNHRQRSLRASILTGLGQEQHRGGFRGFRVQGLGLRGWRLRI